MPTIRARSRRTPLAVTLGLATTVVLAAGCALPGGPPDDGDPRPRVLTTFTVRGADADLVLDTVVVTLQAVGIVLVVAMLIIPGATAYLLVDRMERILLVAVGVSVGASLLGTYLSFHADLATGGTIVVCQALTFLGVRLRHVSTSRRHGSRHASGKCSHAEHPVDGVAEA